MKNPLRKRMEERPTYGIPEQLNTLHNVYYYDVGWQLSHGENGGVGKKKYFIQ